MAVLGSPTFWAALAVSLLVPLTFVFLVRRIEKYGRESQARVLLAFATGAAIVFPLAFLLQRLFIGEASEETRQATTMNLLIVAPLSEELLKALCVALFLTKMTEPADGVVYGAAVGFGYAAIENAGYALRTAGEDGAWSALLLAANRVVTASVAHAALTGVVGFALAGAKLRRAHWVLVPLAFLVAVALHAGYNAFAGATEAKAVPWIVGSAIAIILWILVPISVFGLRRLDGRTRRTPRRRRVLRRTY